MASARSKADQAQQAAVKAQSDADKGRQKAYSYDPNFVQPGSCWQLYVKRQYSQRGRWFSVYPRNVFYNLGLIFLSCQF